MGWVVNITSRPLYPQGKSGTHCIGDWVCSRAGLDGCEKSRPPRGFDPRTVQTVASRYIDWTIPAPYNFPVYYKITEFYIDLWMKQEKSWYSKMVAQRSRFKTAVAMCSYTYIKDDITICACVLSVTHSDQCPWSAVRTTQRTAWMSRWLHVYWPCEGVAEHQTLCCIAIFGSRIIT